LNDLGINDDPIQREDIFDLFQIQQERIIQKHKQGFFEALQQQISKARGHKYIFQKADEFKYTQVVNQTLKAKTERNIL